MIRDLLINQNSLDKLAVIDNGTHFSYRDLVRKAIAVQQRLPQRTGEIAAIFLPNSVNYIAALYGILMNGMTAFPLNIQLTAYEIAPLLTQTSAQAVITSKAYSSLFKDISSVSEILYIEDLSESDAFTPVDAVDPNEPMILLTTSGTTGNAKIVQLSEKNAASSTFDYINKMDFEKIPDNEIRLTLGTPFSSVYGLMVLTACAVKSIPVVVLKEGFTLDALYKLAEEHKITHFEGGVSVGILMEQMAGRPIPYNISTLRYFGLAGSAISASTIRRLMESYPDVEFWSGYGMTEAGPLIAKPDKKVNVNKLDSVGTKADSVTIMIDVNGVLTDIPYERGEIAVKGSNVMIGYYKNKEATHKILKDGYLYTGDIGYIDEDGYLYICGRKKNIILVRSFTVHAEEVEACILNSGLVKDCFVYGEADPSGNETVCADIIPISPHIRSDMIRSYCRDHLALYKQPQRIETVDLIKKTSTGKTERA